MNTELTSIFGLTKVETRVLFSLEDWLTRIDIDSTEDDSDADRKTKWLQKWEENLFRKSFFGLIGESPPQSEKDIIKRIQTIKDPRKRLLIVSESLVFTPYFNIQHRDSAHLQQTVNEANRKVWRTNVFKFAKKVDLDKSILEQWESRYEDSLRAIGGRSDVWKKATVVALATVTVAVTGGLAAPVIGGAIGAAMGLSGAAATSAGLAFLGGGAIATGGAGMAGGTLAIIGGGAILGGAGGLTATRHFFLQHKVVLTQLAKLDASLLTLYEDHSELPSLLNTVIEQQLSVLRDLNKEIETPNLENDDKKRLEKTASYYKESIKRLNKLHLEKSGLN